MKHVIIFTDLDGTLLDSAYSFEKALPALGFITGKEIPLVLCSSKTRAEIELYRKKLDNAHPFITENGGGIFIPKEYFVFDFKGCKTAQYNEYIVLALGARYPDLRKVIEDLRKQGFDIKGFGDMAAEEIAHVSGLTVEEAELARQREFDEPFICHDKEDKMEKLFHSIQSKGFSFTRGRFHHILGDSDKGKAVRMLTSFYKKKHKDIVTIGIGDSLNDAPMLASVDLPILVKKPDGTYDADIHMPNLLKTDGIGPEGWNTIMLNLLRNNLKR